MIKKLFIAAMAALVASASISAQEATAPESGAAPISKSEKFYQTVPKHEFFIEGFAGFGPLLYKTSVPAVSSTVWPWKAGDIMSLKYPVGTGYGGGLGYIWHFHPNVGLLVGAEFAVYNGGIDLAGNKFFSMETARTNNESSDLYSVVEDYWEVQKLMTVQIPVMFQFMAPMGRGNNHFYAAVGAKLGINVLGKFSGGGKNQDFSWFPEISWDGHVGTYTFDESVVERATFYGDDGVDFTNEGDFAFRRLNAIVSAELGFRWKLAQNVGLYTGLYVDYGCLGVNKTLNKGVYGIDIDPTEPDLAHHDANCYNPIINSQHAPDVTFYENSDIQGRVDYAIEKPKAAVTPVHPLGFGFKMKLAFGKVMPTPPPAPPVLPKPDTVIRTIIMRDTVQNTVVVRDTVQNTVVVRDTVTNTVVVRDTVTIIKEVPVEIQKTMRDLSNTLFEFNKFNVGEKARGYLDEIVDWLVENPKVNVEIGGHTDGIGSQEYNQKLSEQRAKTVYNYFVEHGVNKNRLSYKGYGKTEPIADNSTEAGRQQNRRVELKIIQ